MTAPVLTTTQINFHCSKGASTILQRGMTARHTGMLLIQQAWGHKAANQRACILAKGVNVDPLFKLCSRDLMVIVTNLKAIERQSWERNDKIGLLAVCKVRGLPLLLGCDANSHHTFWDSTNVNSRGNDLVENLITIHLDILNTANAPTFRHSVSEEVIDITLCNGSFIDNVKKWRVSDEPTRSDHSQIEFKLDFTVPTGS
ncbi:uncharacterized protein LOC117181940 [Belonocnema kinseyi]|uniref:uncharacterized protein LOC117181940 n=1 Tax=Belonocnema kinseyi TaxID=2817044 RepID=UPI00143DA8E5|nr:uncharacterized protein LOC117181940 [Belonocnema kinseyi]